MHELLRQYAAGQFAQQPDGDLEANQSTQVQARHARFYCQHLHQHRDDILTERGVALLDTDRENIQQPGMPP